MARREQVVGGVDDRVAGHVSEVPSRQQGDLSVQQRAGHTPQLFAPSLHQSSAKRRTQLRILTWSGAAEARLFT